MTSLTWVLILALVMTAAAFTRHHLQARRDAAALNHTIRQLRHNLETATAASKENSARWQAAGNALLEVILFVDTNLNVRFGSPGAETLFGRMPDTDVSLVSYTRSEELEQFCQEALAMDSLEEPPENLEEPLEWQTQIHERTFRVRAQTFKGGTALALTDVSRLQYLDQARRDLVANISHELRTPLTAIRLLLETLESREHPADTSNALENIMVETETLQHMAQELLDISHIESGRASVKLVSTELTPLVKTAINRFRPQAERNAILLCYDALPETPVLADQDQLHRALGNVLHNAIKFSPENSVVNVQATTEDEQVRIDVLDSGPGIPTPDLPRIFERFYRGDRSRHGAGTGLGLAIAKHVIQAHGGTIWAENTPSGGTQVSLTLIRADAT